MKKTTKKMNAQIVVILFSVTALFLCSCGDGSPPKYELERRAISAYTRALLPYTAKICGQLKDIGWAKKNKRRTIKGKTLVFSFSNDEIYFDSTLTYALPENLRANNIADAKTITLLKGTPHVVGYYGSENGLNRTEAIQYEHSLFIIDAKSMKIVKEIKHTGSSPPSQINYRHTRPEQVSGRGITSDEIISILESNVN